MNKPIHPTFQRGFSLVEVTLALGIVAFGLIAIIGLLPRGLGLVRESAAEATAINVLGTVALDLKAGGITPSTNTPVELFFDTDGLPVESPTEGGAGYAVRVQVRGTAKPWLANIQVLWPRDNPINSVETLVVVPEAPQ